MHKVMHSTIVNANAFPFQRSLTVCQNQNQIHVLHELQLSPNLCLHPARAAARLACQYKLAISGGFLFLSFLFLPSWSRVCQS